VDESMTKTKEIATKVVEDWNYNDYDSCNDNCFGPKLHTDKLENRIHKAILEVKLEILAGIDTVEAHIKLKELKAELDALPCTSCLHQELPYPCYDCKKE
jgi:hypothetical protein